MASVFAWVQGGLGRLLRQLRQRLPDLTQRLLSGGFWAASGRALRAVFSAGMAALLARFLTPADLGRYYLVLSVVSTAAMLAQLGLGQVVVRLVAEALGLAEVGQVRRVIRQVFWFGSLSALTAAVIVGVGAWRLGTAPLGSLLAAIWLIILTGQGLVAETLRGFHDIRAASIFGGLLSNLFGVGLLAIWGRLAPAFTLETVLAISVAAGGLSLVLAGGWLWRVTTTLAPADRAEAQPPAAVLRIGLPILVTNLMALLLTQSDLWILSLFRPVEELAVYGAATRLVLLVSIPLGVVNAVVQPMIAQLNIQNRRPELERVLRGSATAAALPAVAVLTLYGLAGAPVLGWVFGAYYRLGADILLILSLGQLVNVLTGSCGPTLVMTGHQRAMMLISVVCGMLTIIGALLSARPLGMAGVAWAISLGTIAQNLALVWFARRVVGIATYVQPQQAWLAGVWIKRKFF